jgi:hypothetical protein
MMPRCSPLLFALLLFSACDPVVDKDDTGGELPSVDADGDGYDSSIDCDDQDPASHPDAQEVCDGIDNDCDGFVDADDPGLVDGAHGYADVDGDGFGDAAGSLTSCELPSGYVDNADDCDDADAEVHPDATELCNGVDDDCDALVDEDDEDLADASVWYVDVDGDGYGDPDVQLEACDAPTGAVADATDCDDGAASINPGATEVCNGVDDDCDALIDDDDDSLVGAWTWYADGDGDGYGDPSASSTAEGCEAPDGMVADATDCDDGAASINPGATEVCNGVDDDCDALVDDDDDSLVGAWTWYADADGDSYGDAASGTVSCTQPAGTVADATDCDDSDAGVSPAGGEICNSIDDDCDGSIDDDDPSVTGVSDWYTDADGDGYGALGLTARACVAPSGTVTTGGDCDDGDAAINPGAAEVCNHVDDDCDRLVDDDDSSVTGQGSWYMDLDGDGYGDSGRPIDACFQPSSSSSVDGDCSDLNAAIHPGATEICDLIDNDCDGLVDDADSSVSGTTTFYLDADLDGYGDAGSSTDACREPSGYVGDDSDCDDGDPDINPGVAEECNGLDDNCDGSVDSARACPCNFERYNGHSYLFCEDNTTWEKARETCAAQENFDLVTVDDATENAWLLSTGAVYDPYAWWWLGYNDIDAESWEEPDGAWEWADGSSSTYTNWGSGQPDNYYNEDCAHMYDGSGWWNDLDCDATGWSSYYLYYICESW